MWAISKNNLWVTDAVPLDRIYGDAFTDNPMGARRFDTYRGAAWLAGRMQRLGYGILAVVDAPELPKPPQDAIESFIDYD